MNDRAKLWVTRTGHMLHWSDTCCGPWIGKWPRKLVGDHAAPSYFDSPEFVLCPVAKRFAASEGEVDCG